VPVLSASAFINTIFRLERVSYMRVQVMPRTGRRWRAAERGAVGQPCPRVAPSPGPAREAGRPSHARPARDPESRSERMMKAVRFTQFGDPEVLEIVDLHDPHPGPGQVRIAVRAAGVNPSDGKKRKGLMDAELPQTMGHEAAGVVDKLGEGVTDVAVGDRVFGLSAEGAAQAELAVLSDYAPIPPSLDFPARSRCRPPSRRPRARWTSSASGAAARCSSTARPEASAAPRFSSPWCAARVISTARPANHDYLRSLEQRPSPYARASSFAACLCRSARLSCRERLSRPSS
jgi:hypothetical protein